MSKIRLDQYLCQNGLVQSRERAKALIMSGIVFLSTSRRSTKAGEMIAPDAKVEVRGHDIGYVSRGASSWKRPCKSFRCARTARSAWTLARPRGGFTDCMLQNGAVKVYAVDVGYGQLAWSLRTDARVINMERTNIRNVKPEGPDRAGCVLQRGRFVHLSTYLPGGRRHLHAGRCRRLPGQAAV